MNGDKPRSIYARPVSDIASFALLIACLHVALRPKTLQNTTALAFLESTTPKYLLRTPLDTNQDATSLRHSDLTKSCWVAEENKRKHLRLHYWRGHQGKIMA